MSSRSRAFTVAAFHGWFVAGQFAIVTALLVLSLTAHVFVAIMGHERIPGLIRLFDVGAAQSLPAYVSTLNLLLAGLLLLLIWALGSRGSRPARWYWLVLGLLFVLLSIDKAVSLHGTLGDILMHRVLRVPPVFDDQSWGPFGIALALVASGLFADFLRRLPRQLALQFAAAFVLFVGGTVGVEFVGGVTMDVGIATPHDILDTLRRLVEEGSEMYAIVLVNAALFGELASRDLRLRAKIEARPEKAQAA